MASRQPTVFDAFDFTDDEFAAARFFTDANILFLKTLRAQAAVEKIALEFDPLNPHKFIQNEAVLRGKIDVLTLLIGD
jgi:hypothetical protein